MAAQHHISTSAAFDSLSKVSQDRNIKVRELALRIVTSHDTQPTAQQQRRLATGRAELAGDCGPSSARTADTMGGVAAV